LIKVRGLEDYLKFLEIVNALLKYSSKSELYQMLGDIRPQRIPPERVAEVLDKEDEVGFRYSKRLNIEIENIGLFEGKCLALKRLSERQQFKYIAALITRVHHGAHRDWIIREYRFQLEALGLQYLDISKETLEGEDADIGLLIFCFFIQQDIIPKNDVVYDLYFKEKERI